MKYIEELSSGDCFSINDTIFLITTDFKKDGSRLSYKLIDGSPKWFAASDIVEKCPVFAMDTDNHFYPIKEEKNQYDTKNL